MTMIVSVAPVGESMSQEDNLERYVDNFNRLCRLCLSEDRLVSIYSNVRGRNVYYVRNFVKFALDLLAVKIDKHDALPKVICERCERSLRIIANFKKKCDTSLDILKQVKEKYFNSNNGKGAKAVEATEPKVLPKRTRKPKSTSINVEAILQKLPQEIHVGKLESSMLTTPPEQQNNSSSIEAQCQRTAEVFVEEADQLVMEEAITELDVIDDVALEEQEDKDQQQKDQDERLQVGPSEHRPDDEACIEDGRKEKVNDLLVDERTHDLKNSHLKTTGKRKKPAIQETPSMEKKKVVCPVCGAMVNHIQSHMLTHDAVRPHQCEQCPKSFTSRNKLQSHINSVHLRKRDFKCDVCGKAFLERNNLKGHMRIHCGERKYTCDVCPKSFLFAGTLRSHKLTHTQDRKHECNICGKLFLLRATLNKHLIVHSGEKPHKCDLCDKRFRTSTHKVVHMRTHTGEKPLFCRICAMSFAYHKARSVHMKSKHAAELVTMGLIDDNGHLKI